MHCQGGFASCNPDITMSACLGITGIPEKLCFETRLQQASMSYSYTSPGCCQASLTAVGYQAVALMFSSL